MPSSRALRPPRCCPRIACAWPQRGSCASRARAQPARPLLSPRALAPSLLALGAHRSPRTLVARALRPPRSARSSLRAHDRWHLARCFSCSARVLSGCVFSCRTAYSTALEVVMFVAHSVRQRCALPPCVFLFPLSLSLSLSLCLSLFLLFSPCSSFSSFRF